MGYTRVSIGSPTLVGNNQIKIPVKYWSSSSQVWNGYGQDIGLLIEKPNGAKEFVRGATLYGGDLGKYTSEAGAFKVDCVYSYDTSQPHIVIRAETKSKDSDSNFYAQSGAITTYKGYLSGHTIAERQQTTCRIFFNFRSVYSEEVVYEDHNRTKKVMQLPATGDQGSTAHLTFENMPPNSCYTRTMYLVPSNGNASSPKQWPSANYTIKTKFTPMSMPTFTAERLESDPTKIKVTWTAGGTINKPQGDSTRNGSIIGGETYETRKVLANVNLESAGTFTVSNLDPNKQMMIALEYYISNLDPSGNWQTTAWTTIPKLGDVKVNIKVNGQYKQSTPHIKINNSYTPIKEVYMKVNGAYKKI